MFGGISSRDYIEKGSCSKLLAEALSVSGMLTNNIFLVSANMLENTSP